MPTTKVKYKDEDGFHYKYPNHNCTRCLNYPCLADMNKLKCDFGAYGCKNFKDIDTFDIWKPKR